MIKNTEHPWGAFLHARARALRWLRDEMHETPEDSVRTMRMDPWQVRLILATPIEGPAQRQSTDPRAAGEEKGK